MNIRRYDFMSRCSSIIINKLDISATEDISGLFAYTTRVLHDIREWDTSRIKSIKMIFYQSRIFEQDLSKWDIKSLIDNDSIFGAFYGTKITMEDIKEWGWVEQRPDLNWELAFESAPVCYKEDPHFFVEIYYYTHIDLWDEFDNK